MAYIKQQKPLSVDFRGKLNGVKTLPVSPSVSRELGMGLRPGGHMPEGIARLRECVLEFIGEL